MKKVKNANHKELGQVIPVLENFMKENELLKQELKRQISELEKRIANIEEQDDGFREQIKDEKNKQ